MDRTHVSMLLLLLLGVAACSSFPGVQAEEVKGDGGDYVCTEGLKHALESMFVHTEDLTQMAQDSAHMCEVCVGVARLSFLYRNDIRYEKDWARIAHDRACHLKQPEEQADCIRITEALISSQEDFINSKASVIPAEERNSTTALAFAAEYRAKHLCLKVHCCPDGDAPAGGKGGKGKPSPKPAQTKKPTTNATNVTHAPVYNHEGDFGNNNLAPAQQAQLSLEEQREKIEQDRASVEEDRKLVQKMKEGIMLARFVLASKAKNLMEREAIVDAAIKNGSMICTNQELKTAPVRYANATNGTVGHNTTNGTVAPVPAAQANGAPAPAPGASASGSSASSAPAPAPVTPVVQPHFREKLRRRRRTAFSGSTAASYVYPNGLEATPADPNAAPPAPPAGYTWRYHYVQE